ncbi:P-type ATPase [Hathewaya histolytica]|uniref:Cation-transporting ATPase n=2 Tax=Hathewaya histolytica TaxID=1498 RepID=A0A4U9RHP4_HATHI|nr:cation-transporting P-type ATPase [Hathewaya histolytica]VTQ90748.1 cation-transporting ATPase [Hathewaya histolytica]
MKDWYKTSYKNVLEDLHSDLELGLNYDKVERNREAYGRNIISNPNSTSMFKLFLKEIFQAWFICSIILMIILYYLNLRYIFVISFGLVGILFLFFLILDLEEEKKLNSLAVLNDATAKVIREGKEEIIRVEDLVVGDIVFLFKNSYVPADIRVIEVNKLKVNELPITGKDYLVEKFPAKLEGDLSIDKMSNMVFKSTIIKEGSGLGIVVSTGMDTKIGSFMKTLSLHENHKEFFINEVRKVMNKFALAGIGLSLLCGVFGYTLGVERQILTEIIATLIFVTLPVQNIIVLVIILFIYMKKKRTDGVFLKNISCIKHIAKTQTLFLNKYGILSKDEMIIRKIFVDDKLLFIKSKGSFEIQKIYKDQQEITKKDINNFNYATLERLINISLLCNDSDYTRENEEFKGASKEIAMIKFGLNNYIDKKELNNKYSRIFKVPIEGNNGIKTTVNKVENNYRANVVGNLDVILENSTHILKSGIEVELKNEDLDKIKESALDMAIEGMEITAFAYRNFNYEPSKDENIESNLVFVGLIGFLNPIKIETYSFKDTCNDLNVNPIVFTDDNKMVAKVFGKEIGIIGDTNEIYSGVEFDFMSLKELNNVVSKEVLFSKLDEHHKEIVVKGHKDKKYYTLAIGNKLIDLPYMSKGDISISMGKNSSNIVKKISDVFIDDLNINKIFKLIFESRFITRFCKTLIYETFLCSSIFIFYLILSLILNKGKILSLYEVFLINIPLVITNCIVILMEDKRSIFNREEPRTYYGEKDYNLNLSFLLMKSIGIALISYVFYSYSVSRFIDIPNSLILFFNLGIGIVFTPLNLINNGIIFKNLVSNILVILNILFMFFITSVLGSMKGFSFIMFSKEHYVFITAILIIHYIFSLSFKKVSYAIEEMYMDYY